MRVLLPFTVFILPISGPPNLLSLVKRQPPAGAWAVDAMNDQEWDVAVNAWGIPPIHFPLDNGYPLAAAAG